jgi:hypothetical protein
MTDETNCPTSTSCGFTCVRTIIGASDVAGSSFQQSSIGDQNYPAGSIINRNFTGIDTSNLTAAPNLLVVPYAFFVNTSSSLNTAMSNNITRMMAVVLFSGQIANWNQLGVNYPTLPVTLCMRHAGSGSHATLDFAVVRGNGWGKLLASAQNAPGQVKVKGVLAAYNSSLPNIYFEDGTTAERTCINTYAGAIGYLDADQQLIMASKAPNIAALTYQGQAPTAEAIYYGRYDFWTNEQAYYDKTYLNGLTDQTLAGLVSGSSIPGILTWIGNTGNIYNNVGAGAAGTESYYWAEQSQMIYEKGTDQTYPSYTGNIAGLPKQL